MKGSPGAARRALTLALPVAAVVAALVYLAHDRPRAPEPDATAAPEPTGTPEPKPVEEAAAPAPAAAAAPGFDLVRVEPDGSAVVAGTAAPGASVTIYADDAPLAQAEADAQGNFVAIFEAKPSSEPQALTLGATTPEGTTTTSDDVVMLLPPAPAQGRPAPEAEPAQGEAAGAAPTPAEAAPESEAAPAPAPTPEVAATAVLRPDAVEVTPAEAAEPRQVTLASISYAEAGQVTLAGLGTAGAALRAYVDDRFAREGRVGADGRWSMELGDLAEGVYTLRIDQLGADGKVASRVETPFQRDFPRPPPPRPGVQAPLGEGAVSVTVQPGNNLWTLARLHYGSGVMYTQIFTANRELIRDPDLIYPGQIFNLPAMDD